MRLQESPPIQPRRNHRDRAWSMLPVLQALMYCLWQKRRRMLRGRGLRHRLGGPTRERPPAETTTGWWGRGGRGKGHREPRFAHWGFLLGRIPAHPGTQWDAHLLRPGPWHYSRSSEHPGDLEAFFYEVGREFGKRIVVVAARPRPGHGRCPISRTGGDKMMGNHSPLSSRGRAVASALQYKHWGSQHLGSFPGVPGTATLSLDL